MGGGVEIKAAGHWGLAVLLVRHELTGLYLDPNYIDKGSGKLGRNEDMKNGISFDFTKYWYIDR